mgnify:FL=1
MGQEGLDVDPRFATADARVENAANLLALVEGWMQSFGSDQELLRYLEEWRIPAAPVLSPEEAMRHPHFTERGMVRVVEDPHFGSIEVTGLPIRFGAYDPPEQEPLAPLLGQHNDEVLREVLSLSTEQIRALQENGTLLSES